MCTDSLNQAIRLREQDITVICGPFGYHLEAQELLLARYPGLA